MIRKTLVAIFLALFGLSASSAAQAQGQRECELTFSAGPDEPGSPAATAVSTPAPAETPTDATLQAAEAAVQILLDDCAEPLSYPGPFAVRPSAPNGPYSGPISLVPAPVTGPVDQPIPVPAATGGDLAHSGTEIFVLAYVGTGLVAFGAVAMGSRRRFIDD